MTFWPYQSPAEIEISVNESPLSLSFLKIRWVAEKQFILPHIPNAVVEEFYEIYTYAEHTC
jgi:hypothetical protein